MKPSNPPQKVLNVFAATSSLPIGAIRPLPIEVFDGTVSSKPNKLIDGLAASVKQYGQLTPVLQDSQGNLLKGQTIIAAVRKAELPYVLARRLEVEGTDAKIAAIHQRLVKKQQTVLCDADDFLLWKQRYEELHPETTKGGNVKAKKREKAQNENLSFCNMAEFLTGRHKRSIQFLIRIALRLPENTKALIRETKLANDHQILLRLVEAEDQYGIDPGRIAEQLIAHPNWSIAKAVSEIRRRELLIQPCNVPQMSSNYQLYHGDFREVVKIFAAESVDFCLFDPPYENDYIPLLTPMFYEGWRLLKSGKFMAVFYGDMFLPKLFEAAPKVEGLAFYWQHIINHGPNWGNRIKERRIYSYKTPVLMFYKGKPHKYKGPTVPDIIPGGPKTKLYHRWEQPLAECEWLIKNYSKPGDTVLDFFIGGGTSLIAALKHGRNCIGIDISKDAIEITRRRIASLRP